MFSFFLFGGNLFFYKLNFEDTNNVPLKGFLDLGFNYPHTGLWRQKDFARNRI